jgi:hypothetical protein
MMHLLHKQALRVLLVLAMGGWMAQSVFAADVTQLKELFNWPTTNALIDTTNPGTETPRRFALGTVFTGFTWGGYFAGTNASNSILAGSGDGGQIYFIDNSVGTYAYTIFDPTGGNNGTTTINLSGSDASISIQVGSATLVTPAANRIFRLMVRESGTGNWFLSSQINISNALTSPYTVKTKVSTLTWTAVSSASNTNLNALTGGDEAPLTLGSAATPNLSAVNGSGIYFDLVASGPFRLNDITWDAGKPILGATVSKADPDVAGGLLTHPPVVNFPPATPSTGTLTLTNVGTGTLNISSISLVGPASNYITFLNAPVVPQNLGAGATYPVTVKFNPTVKLTESTTASLQVVSNSGGGSNVTNNYAIRGRIALEGSVLESFYNVGGESIAAGASNNSETPRRMVASPGGSGFTWGAYSSAQSAPLGLQGSQVWAQGGGGVNRLLFYSAAAGTSDAGNSAAYHGSYAYTVFDSLGSNTPDRYLDLKKIRIYTDQAPPELTLRWLVRDNNGHWFLSKDVTPRNPLLQDWTQVDVDLMTGWYRVNTAAETYMNTAQTNVTRTTVAISAPATLTEETPNLTAVTGGGLYIEQGDTNAAERRVFTMPDMEWLQRPSGNDRLTLTASDVSNLNLTLVPNRTLSVLNLNADVTSGSEVIVNGLTLNYTPNDGGILEAYIVNDANLDNLPQADQGLSTSTVINSGSLKVDFIDPRTFVKNAPQKLLLAVKFADKATTPSGKTYTITLGSSNFEVDQFNGGAGDQLVLAPQDPVSVNMAITKLPFPNVLESHATRLFLETWDNVTTPTKPATFTLTPVAFGEVQNSDVPWTWSNDLKTSTPNNIGAGFTNETGTVMAGVETKNLTTDPTPPFGPFTYTHTIGALTSPGIAYDLIEVNFTLMITQTDWTDGIPSFSFRTYAGGGPTAMVRLIQTDSRYLSFQVNCFKDPDTRAFTVNNYNSGSLGGEASPKSLPEYSQTEGVGTYRVKLRFAPYAVGANYTKVRIQFTNTATGEEENMDTVINGALPTTINGLSLGFGRFANAYMDDIDMKVYTNSINAADKAWSLY